MAPVLGVERCEALTAFVLNFETQADLRAMRRLLQPG
jgi:hypothetical protein